MKKKEPFIINRLKSVGFAFKGMLILIKTEASIKIQLCIAIVVTCAGFYFEISKTMKEIIKTKSIFDTFISIKVKFCIWK